MKLTKFISFFLVLTTIILSLSSCIEIIPLFSEFESEVDYDLSYVKYDCVLFKNGIENDFFEHFDNLDATVENVICVSGEKIYFVYSVYSDQRIGIASINVDGNNFNTLYEVSQNADLSIDKQMASLSDKTELNVAYYNNGNIYFQYRGQIL